MILKKKFFLTLLFISQFLVAQEIDVQNRLEHSSEEVSVYDMNSITIPVKKSKKNNKKEGEVSVEDLQRIVTKRRAARYRKVRKETEKCFNDVIEGGCEDKEIDLKVIRKKKKKSFTE